MCMPLEAVCILRVCPLTARDTEIHRDSCCAGRGHACARLLLLGDDVVQAVVEELQALLQQRRDAQLQPVAVARVRGRLRHEGSTTPEFANPREAWWLGSVALTALTAMCGASSRSLVSAQPPTRQGAVWI